MVRFDAAGPGMVDQPLCQRALAFASSAFAARIRSTIPS